MAYATATRGPWHLEVELPEALAASRDQLLDLVVAVADRAAIAPLRRSRRAATYNPHFQVPQTQPGDVFVKVIDPSRSGIERIKQLVRGTAAGHLKRITTRLAKAGFDAPPIWIAGSNQNDRRELIVSPRVRGLGPLQALAQLGTDLPNKRRILGELGAEIARLHRAGFVHGDLTPFNVFIQPDKPARFIFLDHERTRSNYMTGRTRRSLRNLVQLGRFALPGLTRSDRLRVMFAYAERIGCRDRQALARRVAQRLAARLERDGGAQLIAPLRAVKP